MTTTRDLLKVYSATGVGLGGSITFSYLSGTNMLDYSPTENTQISWPGGNLLTNRGADFVIVFGLTNIVVTLAGDQAIPMGSMITLGLERLATRPTVFNVMDYGAVGDGVTDDTIPLQTALNAAYLKGGGRVRTPYTHKTTSTLNGFAKVALVGDNMESSQIKATHLNDVISISGDGFRVEELRVHQPSQADYTTSWANSTAYTVGQIMKESDDNTVLTYRSVWVCQVAHTSVAAGTKFAADRAAHPTYWTELVIGSHIKLNSGVTAWRHPYINRVWTTGGVPQGTTAWAISTAYTVGLRMRDTTDNTVWKCAVAHTSGAGAFATDRTNNPSYWTAEIGQVHAINLDMANEWWVVDCVNGDSQGITPSYKGHVLVGVSQPTLQPFNFGDGVIRGCISKLDGANSTNMTFQGTQYSNYAPWTNGTAYTVGNAYWDSTTTTVWKCAVAHTSAATGTFAADRAANGTYWTAHTAFAKVNNVSVEQGYVVNSAAGSSSSVGCAAFRDINAARINIGNFNIDAGSLNGIEHRSAQGGGQVADYLRVRSTNYLGSGTDYSQTNVSTTNAKRVFDGCQGFTTIVANGGYLNDVELTTVAISGATGAVTTNGTNATKINCRIVDSKAVNLSQFGKIEFYLSDVVGATGYTAVTASGTVDVGSQGTKTAELVTKKHFEVTLDTAGRFEILITDTAKTPFYIGIFIPRLGIGIAVTLSGTGVSGNHLTSASYG